MEQRMMDAACSGDVNILHQLLQENPFILSDVALLNPHENPLTIATKANQLVFVREALRLKPELARELNQDGIRPLDVASAYGNVEIVGEILAAVGPEICRLAGRNGMTAIHYAAENGKVEIIDQLISACPDSAKDATSFGETALHLAVKYFKFEALGSMLEWLEKVDMMEVVNLGDKEGNTVLHYAVSRKQLVSVELLLEWSKRAENRLEVNAVNKKGLTAMDILDILIESSNDIHLREILRRAGGDAASELHVVSETPRPDSNQHTNNRLVGERPKNWKDILKHFEFQWHRDSPGEARETLLLIVALIATVTFQAGIDPPSYLFEAPNEANFTTTATTTTGSDTAFLSPQPSPNLTELLNEIQRSSAETSSLAPMTVFLAANSVALTTAVSIIDYLTVGLPFQRELRVSMVAMISAYSWSLGHTRPTAPVKTAVLMVSILMPLFLRWLPYMITELRKLNRTNAVGYFKFSRFRSS